MSQILHRQSIRTPMARTTRSRTLELTLIVLGALGVLFGAYTLLVPASWVLADLAEGWYLGSFVLGGVLLTGGFGALATTVRDEAGEWTASAITSAVLAALAAIGAVAAAVVLIF